MRAKRTKAAALTAIPQSEAEVAGAIARAGELMRAIAQRQAEADAEIQEAGARAKRDLAQPAEELDQVRRGIQTYCEAHRDALTRGGRVKFAAFGSGTVRWRTRPAKVGLRQIATVIEAVRGLGLHQFLRTTVEVNKEAMLADPATARQVAGVTIGSEGEDFVIEPAAVGVGS